MKSISVKNISLIGLGISINVVGSFIAYTLKLPIYLDSIGTIFIAAILGPNYAMISGVLGSIVSGITFDVYSIYFAPVQITTGLLSGIMFRKGFLDGVKTPLGTFIFVLPTSIISAMIAAIVFEGVTSAGSSYIVQALEVLSIGNLFSNIFLTQIITDYMDKFLGVVLVNLGISAIPKNLKSSFIASK